jgi:folate-binding protein YgfZ
MSITALPTYVEGLGASRMGQYRGATTAVAFSDEPAELAALRAGCGAYDLGFRAKVALAGKDRVRWLNGMVSNNIRDLAAGHGVYAFILNPQGHILGDLTAYNRGESLLVDTDRSQAEKILAIFRKYIIMDKVEVSDLSEQLTALGVSGPKARGVLAACGFELPELTAPQGGDVQLQLYLNDVKWRGVDCALIRRDENSYEIWLAPGEVRNLWDALLAAGATPVGAEALETYRILSGVPLYGVDIRERELPQETEQARALSFTKGCYIGQEIVERIRARGNVHRMFTGFVVENGAPVAVGAKIVARDAAAVDAVAGTKEVGEVTSVASLPGEPGRTVALGYIRREAGAPGREVTIGGATAKVVKLPLRLRCLDEQAMVK